MKTHSMEWLWTVSGLSLMLLVSCSMEPKKETKKVTQMPMMEEQKEEKKIDKKKMEKVELPAGVPNSAFEVTEQLKPVYFDLQRSRLSDTALAQVKENVAWLKTQPPYLIAIVGVSDKRGSPAHNRTLAERRAQNLKNVYKEEGISEERMQIIAIGEDTEACPAMDEECLKFSRRADTRLEQKAFVQR